MSTGDLKQLWRETFGTDPRSGNVPWLRKRLAWGIQAQALGGLSDRAKQRIEELIPTALGSMPWGFRSFPERNAPTPPLQRDRRVPAPGNVLTRRYKGRTIELLVLEGGRFEFEGLICDSLTAAAKAATGSHWNGVLFWFGRERKAG